MLILGIYTTPLNVSWAIVDYTQEDNHYNHITSGVIKIPKNYKLLSTKLAFISTKFSKIIEKIFTKYEIDIIATNKIVMNSNFDSVVNFANLVGVITSVIGKYKKNFVNKVSEIEVHPRIVKRFVTGDTNANKEIVNKCIYKIFKCNDELVANALALAYTVTKKSKIY